MCLFLFATVESVAPYSVAPNYRRRSGGSPDNHSEPVRAAIPRLGDRTSGARSPVENYEERSVMKSRTCTEGFATSGCCAFAR